MTDMLLRFSRRDSARWRNHETTILPSSKQQCACFFLACGTSRSLFDVLNHAGISLSYLQAIAKLKKLRLERLEQTRKITHTCAFMVNEQKQIHRDLEAIVRRYVIPAISPEYPEYIHHARSRLPMCYHFSIWLRYSALMSPFPLPPPSPLPFASASLRNYPLKGLIPVYRSCHFSSHACLRSVRIAVWP
jgi:hypothetical protein